MTAPRTPAQAWAELHEGNARFVSGSPEHPAQDRDRRDEIAAGQRPFAVILGCSDSRVAAEIVFDRGLGDLFVVRTAGHVVDGSVLGSMEFGVSVLGAPLVVVLAHDSCGAVTAAAHALATGEMPGGFIRTVVERLIPSILDLPSDTGHGAGGAPAPTPEVLTLAHLRHTVDALISTSATLAAEVAAGRAAVVGLQYQLADGEVHLREVRGEI